MGHSESDDEAAKNGIPHDNAELLCLTRGTRYLFVCPSKVAGEATEFIIWKLLGRASTSSSKVVDRE